MPTWMQYLMFFMMAAVFGEKLYTEYDIRRQERKRTVFLERMKELDEVFNQKLHDARIEYDLLMSTDLRGSLKTGEQIAESAKTVDDVLQEMQRQSQLMQAIMTFVNLALTREVRDELVDLCALYGNDEEQDRAEAQQQEAQEGWDTACDTLQQEGIDVTKLKKRYAIA